MSYGMRIWDWSSDVCSSNLAPVAAHDDDVGPLLKRRHAFDQGTEIVAVDESADVGFDAPVLPGCILGIGMPTQWHDARGPAASMGTGQEARGAGKEPDFVAMADRKSVV